MERRVAIDRGARRLTLLGGLLGVVAAAGLGSLRYFNAEHPENQAQLLGSAVFTLVYMSPFLLTLVVSRTHDPAARAGLLLALGLLSFVASFSTWSLVTVVFLPATGSIFLASVWSLRVVGRRALLVLPYFAAGLVGAAAIVFSFFALLVLEDEETHCWVLIRDASGREEWQPRPNVGGAPYRLSVGMVGPEIEGSSCFSDIITDSEAAKALGILAAASVLVIGASRLPGPAAPGERSPGGAADS